MIIPTPKAYRKLSGAFPLSESVDIVCKQETVFEKKIVSYLQKRLAAHSGIKLSSPVEKGHSDEGIVIVLDKSSKGLSEAYELEVSPRKIWMQGEYSGLLYAVEALCQLLECRDGKWSCPCVHIENYPTFEWRGLMLDCSRHFISKPVLLRYIDILPKLGMNRLHFHFNDDHGWRMESESHPELCGKGAYVLPEPERQGFYTRDDLREIVAYARDLNVTVVPEIEIPGHSLAVMKSYPWLCCTENPEWTSGHQKDLYCPGKESTNEFLFDILEEIMEIFPSPYIHIGGDEAPKDRWQECEHCQQRMKSEGLKDEQELLAYLTGKVCDFIHSRKRKIIGWEEILEGDPDQDIVVQWWRYRQNYKYDGMLKALERGHQVIASPNAFTYLNFPIVPDKNFIEDRTSDLRKIYTARLIPEDLPAEYADNIKGAECCLWTEHLDESMLEGMLFPRILACAELMWNNPEDRNYTEFLDAIREREAYWQAEDVSYGPYIREDSPH